MKRKNRAEKWLCARARGITHVNKLIETIIQHIHNEINYDDEKESFFPSFFFSNPSPDSILDWCSNLFGVRCFVDGVVVVSAFLAMFSLLQFVSQSLWIAYQVITSYCIMWLWPNMSILTFLNKEKQKKGIDKKKQNQKLFSKKIWLELMDRCIFSHINAVLSSSLLFCSLFFVSLSLWHSALRICSFGRV